MTSKLISQALGSLGIRSGQQPGTGKRHDQPGQAIVVIALVMVGLIAVAGLVLDGGNAYAQRRFMQNAADAGAFAGTRVLATRSNNSAATECAIRFAVETFAKLNGVGGPAADPICNQLDSNIKAYFIDPSGNQIGAEIGVNLGVPNNATGVRVITHTLFNTFLLGFFGEGTGSAAARAAVQSGELKGTKGVMPLAPKDTTDLGAHDPDPGECSFKTGSSCRLMGETVGPGNFHWLDFQTKGSSPQDADFKCGNPNEPYLSGLLHQTLDSGYIEKDYWVCGTPGKKVGNGVTDGLEYWMQKTMNKEWIIPVYDRAQGEGNNLHFHITGFAIFVPTAYEFGGKQGGSPNLCRGQGSSKCIEGTFKKWATSGDFVPYTICTFSACGMGAVE